MINRAGTYVSNLSGEMQYYSFLPALLPPSPPIEFDSEIVNLLAEANRSLGLLNGISNQVPDINLFVSMYIRKEALLSSQIEGTQATIDDILNPKIEKNKNQDIEEVLSYIKASQYAKEQLNSLPVCNRLIRDTHRILMDNSRGSEKTPGKFRRSQNWIGPVGGSLKDARYIPPNQLDMQNSMSELEKFINTYDEFSTLIKIALIHYQFETIHPFLDGNGRIGRLLISLYLIEQKVLSHETLYTSYYLKKHRREYYDRLNEVRDKGNYEQWIKFFLLAIKDSAQDSIKAIGKLVELHDRNYGMIKLIRGREGITLEKVFKYIEQSPIIDIGITSKKLELSYNAVAKAVNILVDMKILAQTSNVKRNRIFAYEEYLDILRKGT